MRVNRAGSITLCSCHRVARTVMVAALGLFILTGISGECLGAKQDKKDVKDVVAKWSSKTITKQELEARLNNLPDEAKARFQTPDQKKLLLDTLVQVQIVATEAKAKKLDKKADVAAMIDDMTNSVLYQTYLKQIVDAVKKPTDSDLEAFYKAHRVEYVAPKQIKAQHILLMYKADAKPEDNAAVAAKADEILKEIQAGGDFSKLAEKYSEDTETSTKGGDLGFFAKDQMIPVFANAAFALKKGEVSNPVKAEYGIHIIKVNDITEEKQLDFKEAAPSIRTKLEEEGRGEAVKKELDRLKKKYKVEILDIK